MRDDPARTGYGFWDLTRQVARRVQREREAAEAIAFRIPPRPADPDPALPPPSVPPPSRTEDRPLAA